MNRWILNHYAVPQQYYYLACSYYFAQNLIKAGHREVYPMSRTNLRMGYDLMERYDAGIHVNYSDLEGTCLYVEKLRTMPREKYTTYCNNARRAAADYDFKELTEKLLAVIEE